jgi:hypothetical protein
MKGENSLYLALTLFVTVNCAAWASDSSKDSTKSDYALANGTAAIDRAIEYTGFSISESSAKSAITQAQLVTISDDNTPFVAGQINGHEVWKIKFEGIRVGKDQQAMGRDYSVLLDPITGQLLKIFSISDEFGSSDTLPEPSAHKSKEYLQKRGIKFQGLPDKEPNITFTEALSVCPLRPARAKSIRGIYTDHMASNFEYPNTWIIIIRGAEFLMSASGPTPDQVPINQRNSILCAVNANTGVLEYVMNAPYDLDYIRLKKHKK